MKTTDHIIITVAVIDSDTGYMTEQSRVITVNDFHQNMSNSHIYDMGYLIQSVLVAAIDMGEIEDGNA